VVCFPPTCKNSTSSNPRTPCDYFKKIPLCSHTSLPLGCCCCIHHEKQTHPPPTHSPTYPNRSLSRNPKPRPRCVRSKKPNVVTRVFGQMGENPRIKQTQNELGKKEKTQTNKQTDIHQIHNIVPFLPIPPPPPPPPPPPSLHRLQNCYFCALLRVKERRRRRRE
jgi:hypothetical protein